MGLTNTPPVSPRESENPESDDEQEVIPLDQDNFEVVELSDDEVLEDNGSEPEEDEEGMEDLPDEAIVKFELHNSKYSFIISPILIN